MTWYLVALIDAIAGPTVYWRVHFSLLFHTLLWLVVLSTLNFSNIMLLYGVAGLLDRLHCYRGATLIKKKHFFVSIE